MMENPLPVMQVYDQTKYIEKQDKKIKKIKNEAKALNDIAQDMNQQIYMQDEKLGDLTKELATDLSMIRAANDELEEARERSSSSNSKLCCWVMVILVILVIMGVSFYLITRPDNGGGGGGGSGTSGEAPPSSNTTVVARRMFDVVRPAFDVIVDEPWRSGELN
jgi:ATP-dependent Zn protease